jgi:hypothetical protein
MSDKPILDVTAGSRSMWFDKNNHLTLFTDVRRAEYTQCDGRSLSVQPDREADFRALPFDNETFYLVVFDPPHLNKLGKGSWMAQKYGRLNETWEQDIKQGFDECMRVLKPNGVLVFKWNEHQIPVKKIISVIGTQPLFGHPTRHSKTIWMSFMKL